jgi:TonB family protein
MFCPDSTCNLSKHIETPEYPPLARVTRQMGEIVLLVTIDADGKVQRVAAILDKPNQQVYPLLQNAAVDNMQHWTFTKPPFAPYIECCLRYEDDPSLPPSGGSKNIPVITSVMFDIPDRVRILTNVPIIDTNKQ